MTLALPLALAAGLLAVPLAALFLLKPRPRPVPVATLMFWRRAAPATRRRTAWGRLRNPAALLLALAALALLVLAAADPRPAGAATAAVTVLVVDDSASMAATDVPPTRLAAAKRAALSRLGGGPVGVVTAAGRPRVALAPSADPGAVRRAVQGLAQSDAPRDLPAAVALARRLAGDGGRVVVLSGASRRPPGVDEWAAVGTPAGNLGITAFRPRRTGAGFDLLVEVANAADTPADARLDVELDGRLLDARPVRVAANRTWRQVLRLTAEGGGRLHAKLVAPAPDPLPADDHAWAVLPPAELLGVSVVPAAGTPGDEAVRAAVEELAFVRKPVGRTPGAGVTVYHRRRPDPLPDGPVLVIDPPDDSPLWALTPPVADPTVRVVDAESPLVGRLTLPRDAFGRPRGLRPLGEAKVAAEAGSGEPVLVEWVRPAPLGRVAVLSADLDGGGLRFSPVFPALIGTVLQHLAGVRADLPDQPAAGDRVRFDRTGGPFELRAPDGRVTSVVGDLVGPLDPAGVWEVGPAGGAAVWAVATRPSGDADLRPAAGDDQPPLAGRPPWVGLAGGAVLVLAVEWLAYHRRWVT